MRKNRKTLALSSTNVRPKKLTTWVEQELSEVIDERGEELGMKPSQVIRRLIILGLSVEDKINVVSDIKPQKGN